MAGSNKELNIGDCNLMEEYLQLSEVIDWQHPTILQLSRQIRSLDPQPLAIAKACFEWVRDEVKHSVDYQMNPVTCIASDVLKYRTGFCFAKSHLLSALLRSNGIPTGFCYQRLSINDDGAPYSLHDYNAIHLPEFGWYRVDPRGNKPGINARFLPPIESLAYSNKLDEETNFDDILAEPLPIVIAALKQFDRWDEMCDNLPDIVGHVIA
jgi:transglutaminase-like putative cysteine protease